MGRAREGDDTTTADDVSGARLALGYAVLAVAVTAAVAFSIGVGHGENPPPAVAGVYRVTGTSCLDRAVDLEQSGQFVDLSGDGASGKLRLEDERLTGTVECSGGGNATADLRLGGAGERRRFTGTLGGDRIVAARSAPLPEPGASAQPAKKRSGEETFGRLMLAIAAVILAARLVGTGLARLAQPRVMGEVLAGILLGPTILGAFWPEAKDYLFPPDIVALLGGAAQIGLAFYLFLVGMEVDPQMIRKRIRRAAYISNASVAVPMTLGLLAALPVYRLLAPDVDYLPFALFIGVSMSITAFPVLARILAERRMLHHPVGAMAIAGAAIDDVSAWGLLALATAVAGSGSGLHALVVVGLAGAFTAGMIIVVRPFLGRVSTAYDEAGRVPAIWIGAIVVGVLLSAYIAQQIGIAAIFGAFVMGLIMPRHAGLTGDVSGRLEEFVVIVLLPLFFVVTGLRTDVGALNRPELWLIALGLLVVAVVGKWLGAMGASRYVGLPWRDSSAIGALMNTRGLAELIVLNIGLELGLISTALFTMLVLMALVTTLAAGPALRLLDPRGEFSDAPEDELRRALPPQAPQRSILVAPQDDRAIDMLLELAVPLARSEPPRELVLLRLVTPAQLASGLSVDDREIGRATAELNMRRELLEERGVRTRAAAFTSPDPSDDLVRLASDETIDLLLMNGRRPLLGEGVPRGEVGEALANAPCDVAVLVDRRGTIVVDAAHPVVVPFGGADHDWAALELGAWIAHSGGAPLRLLGAAAGGDGGRDASRLLANASLVVQQLANVATEPVLVSGAKDVERAAEEAGLLVLGLSDRWREQGLGPVRSEIARVGSGADDLRPPRPPARRARTRRRHDAVPLVRLRRDDDRPLKTPRRGRASGRPEGLPLGRSRGHGRRAPVVTRRSQTDREEVAGVLWQPRRVDEGARGERLAGRGRAEVGDVGPGVAGGAGVANYQQHRVAGQRRLVGVVVDGAAHPDPVAGPDQALHAHVARAAGVGDLEQPHRVPQRLRVGAHA